MQRVKIVIMNLVQINSCEKLRKINALYNTCQNAVFDNRI